MLSCDRVRRDNFSNKACEEKVDIIIATTLAHVPRYMLQLKSALIGVTGDLCRVSNLASMSFINRNGLLNEPDQLWRSMGVICLMPTSIPTSAITL